MPLFVVQEKAQEKEQQREAVIEIEKEEFVDRMYSRDQEVCTGAARACGGGACFCPAQFCFAPLLSSASCVPQHNTQIRPVKLFSALLMHICRRLKATSNKQKYVVLLCGTANPDSQLHGNPKSPQISPQKVS